MKFFEQQELLILLMSGGGSEHKLTISKTPKRSEPLVYLMYRQTFDMPEPVDRKENHVITYVSMTKRHNKIDEKQG